MAEELKSYGWVETDLATRRNNDPLKLEIAARLRRETTLPLKGTAARVHLGPSKAAPATLHRFMRQSYGVGASQERQSFPVLAESEESAARRQKQLCC